MTLHLGGQYRCLGVPISQQKSIRSGFPTAIRNITAIIFQPHTTFARSLGKQFSGILVNLHAINVANRRVLLDKQYHLGGTHS